MTDTHYRVYGYRWVVLGVFMLIVMMNQLLWINFAAVTTDASKYFGVSELSIGMLSMCFMIAYLVVSFPASWLIDTYGVRIGVGAGAVLTGVFGLVRGLVAGPGSYNLVLLAQIGIAVGQPFLLNAITTIAARWFPRSDRATASGLGSLAMYVGIFGGLVITPWVVQSAGLAAALQYFGFASAVTALSFVFIVRERPPSPPCSPDHADRSLVIEGLAKMLRQRDFQILLAVFLVGLGAFNSVTTWIEQILRPHGFGPEQAGWAGGAMILGGIIGAVAIPLWSDSTRRRVPFLIAAVAGAGIGLLGIVYAADLTWLVIASVVFGASLLSAGPLGFQYAAEITFPAPEGTSNGMLLLMGQISGIVFILGLDALKAAKTGSMDIPLLGMCALFGVALALVALLKEPNWQS